MEKQILTSVRIAAKAEPSHTVASRLEHIERSLRFIEGQLRIIVAVMAIDDLEPLEPIPSAKDLP